jgi:hypothetical protein
MPSLSPRLLPVALAGLALASAAPARAASLATDAPCYIAGVPVAIHGTGFAAGQSIAVTGLPTALTALSDSTGAFGVQVAQAPGPADPMRPGVQTVTATATNVANPAETAATTFSVANYAFATDGGVKPPSALRTWRFSGFMFAPGAPIYGHFRHHGRTWANFRFGVPQGPCGTLKRRAPLIPSRHLAPGLWTIQVDQSPIYHAATRPALVAATTVTRRRSRARAGSDRAPTG